MSVDILITFNMPILMHLYVHTWMRSRNNFLKHPFHFSMKFTAGTTQSKCLSSQIILKTFFWRKQCEQNNIFLYRTVIWWKKTKIKKHILFGLNLTEHPKWFTQGPAPKKKFVFAIFYSIRYIREQSLNIMPESLYSNFTFLFK